MKRVIFLDVDGPLIPGTAWRSVDHPERLNARGIKIGYRFAPYAVDLITRLCAAVDAKIVWNTMHNMRGIDAITEDAVASGLSPKLFHPERPNTLFPYRELPVRVFALPTSISRKAAIQAWLKDEPMTDWIVIDDEKVWPRRQIKVDFQGGLSGSDYDRALDLFESDAPRLGVRIPT